MYQPADGRFQAVINFNSNKNKFVFNIIQNELHEFTIMVTYS